MKSYQLLFLLWGTKEIKNRKSRNHTVRKRTCKSIKGHRFRLSTQLEIIKYMGPAFTIKLKPIKGAAIISVWLVFENL